ncbi:MAG: endonuclease/exonuclease/phosphatase family protein [Rhodothermaceae bacterium]|nr:endonuclease/exonuclease/phosphatase family protein [Rhodothermaceae bacterium]
MQWLIRLLVASLIVVAAIYMLSRPSRSIPPKATEGDVVRIATANLLYMNRVPDKVAEVLVNQDIDVLVLLEWTGRNANEGMLKEHGFLKSACEPRSGVHGICVFYKAPLPLEASVERAPVEGPCNMPFVTIRLEGEHPIGIQAIHPPPPIRACGNSNATILNYHASTVEQGRVNKSLGVLQPGDAAIVMGDFNALASWRRVQQFSEAGLADAFNYQSEGLAPTWSPNPLIPAFARIDYIWTAADMSLVDSWSLDIPGSDHRMVVSEVRL